MMEWAGVNHKQPQSGQSRPKSLFCNNHNLRDLRLDPFFTFACKRCLTEKYFKLSKHVIGIYVIFLIYVIQYFPTYLDVALILLLRKGILEKSPPPYIHVSCQRMCVQEGVSDILATPVKGWKIENTQCYNRTGTSIVNNKEWTFETRQKFEKCNHTNIKPLWKPF